MKSKKFILIIRWKRDRNKNLLIHTGGPLNNNYWTIAPFNTVEKTRKYLVRYNKTFIIRMVRCKGV